MSGSGVTYYDEELKHLHRLLKALPDTIPIGDAHNFLGYVPNAQKVLDTGCKISVVSHALEVSFGSRRTPAGDTIIPTFKSQGPCLEEVVTVLRDHITGNGGSNVLLTLWVDDLTKGAVNAIEASGARVPRPIQTTVAKRLLEDDVVVEQAKKKQKKDAKLQKDAKRAQTEAAKKKTEHAIRSLADWSEDVVADTQGGRKASANKTWDGEAQKLVF
ncbi:hypothetical protein C8R44DRAFT_363745 [Mycena epipterygia]|nr:hypothetical protein C8R44DRAFT_745587 [Mycena epipterygia]KAJ7136903.1 hypothetical protein C8R44DRAFT_363745 [Mycena epipterygia]